jgi:hypothetical protein
MRKLIVAIAMLVALAVAAGASAAGSARWIDYPTCTATSAALTCSGRAAGVQPRVLSGLGVETVISGRVRYTCTNPLADFFYVGPLYPYQVGDPLISAGFKNGTPFSVEFTPPAAVPYSAAQAWCGAGTWIRDPSYYDVHVQVGWGIFGSATPVIALDAAIGTLSPT